MSLKDQFRKLIGKDKVEPPVDGWENLSRAVVRNGNLDWRGLPIDRRRDGETPFTLVERPRGYFEQVADYLGRAGAKIERRWNAEIPSWNNDQFQRDAATTETARERMMRGRRIEFEQGRTQVTPRRFPPPDAAGVGVSLFRGGVRSALSGCSV